MEHRDNIKLSERLAMSAGMVTAGSSVADVGCDHAHTCIWLVKHRDVPRAVAMDVRPGPLSHADANIRLYGLGEKIETRLSDGLTALKQGETDTIIIAGMGGTLTVQILERGLAKAKTAKELILQPQSDLGLVRSFLMKHGFIITEEKMCKELGKFYTSMRVKIKTDADAAGIARTNLTAAGKISGDISDRLMQAVYDEFGEYLLKTKNGLLHEVLLILKEKNERILERISAEGSGDSAERKVFFEKEKELIRKALKFYEVVQ
ncbi:MAG: SAM-dependent methyltransferase [Lachnospiraceae bacterium]|nr:SAM-dependent methyltransferase [Lachnospiraceae bacterium]